MIFAIFLYSGSYGGYLVMRAFISGSGIFGVSPLNILLKRSPGLWFDFRLDIFGVALPENAFLPEGAALVIQKWHGEKDCKGRLCPRRAALRALG